MPLTLSIVTPSYNHGRYLERTIQSVLNQDYPHVEHLVIDGASTDNTIEVLRRYSDRLAYWESVPDEGHRYALKKGFDRATGEIVAWQNADDYYEPNVFGRVMAVFAHNPAIDLVYGNIRVVDAADRELAVLHHVPNTRSRLTLFGGLPFQNHAAFFRRRLWDAIGGIRFDDYNFDVDLIMRAALVANAHFIRAILGNYRNHAGSQWFSGSHRQLEVTARAVQTRHLGAWSRLPPVLYPALSGVALLRRAALLTLQGDAPYLVGQLRKRIAAR